MCAVRSGAAVAFLLSPAAAFISGVTLAVDGASHLYRQLAPVPNHSGIPAWDGFHLSADVPDEV